MATASTTSPRHVLDPMDRMSEILFGLIMVLTFTCSLSVAEAVRSDVRAMLIGALGCNLAWAVIDAVFYLMGCLAETGRGLATLRAVRGATGADEGRRLVAEALPSVIASVLEPSDLDRMREGLKRLPEPPTRTRLRGEDIRGALAVFFIVFLSTFPVAIPFLVMQEVGPALRVSNGIAVAMLFGIGQSFGHLVGWRRWRTGAAMVALGCALVGLTIALGG